MATPAQMSFIDGCTPTTSVGGSAAFVTVAWSASRVATAAHRILFTLIIAIPPRGMVSIPSARMLGARRGDCQARNSFAAMKRKLILDVDTGTDDAIAIMLAALHPALELVACTTVNGNVDVGQATDNTLRVLEWIGRTDVPVYEGLHRPIARRDFPIPRAVRSVTHYIHGNELDL